MSGRKQHYIPQSLLKGFAIDPSAKVPQVWVFRADRAPHISAVKDAAAERDFYSSKSPNGEPVLDDRITTHEDTLGRHLRTLRASESGAEVDAQLASEVVAHLGVRSAALRDLFQDGLDEVFDGLDNLIRQPEALRTRVGIDGADLSPNIHEALEQTLERVRAALPVTLPKPLLRRFAIMLLRENFVDLYTDLTPALTNAIERLRDFAPATIRDGHAKVLLAGMVPEPRVTELARMKWTVQQTSEMEFILPDCVAIAFRTSNDWVPYLEAGDDFEIVVMPLNPSRVLVGRRDPELMFDSSAFNERAAGASVRFFVSASASEIAHSLAGRIGRSPRQRVREAARDALREVPAEPTLERYAPNADSAEVRYGVSFLDCASEDEAAKIAQIVGVLRDSMAATMPLNRLESVTFARDYDAAVAGLDRGFSVNEPQPSTNSFATAPLVLRAGQVRCCIVLRDWIGKGLARLDESPEFGTALHVIAVMLARVAFVELVDTALPGVLLAPHADDWGRVIRAAISGAPSNYFSARISAWADPTAGDSARQLFVETLNDADTEMKSGSRDDRSDLLRRGASAVSRVLGSAASLLGNLMGREDHTPDPLLASVLASAGLERWFDLYRRDLAGLFERRGRWQSIEEFYMLDSHVERLLWRYEIFPWRTDDGTLQIAARLEAPPRQPS